MLSILPAIFFIASSAASCSMALLGILLYSQLVLSLRAAAFANLSASSLPYIPTCALTHENFIFHSLFSRLATFFLIFSTKNAWFLGYLSESKDTRLSVNMVAVRGLMLLLCRAYIFSSALSMANCSA